MRATRRIAVVLVVLLALTIASPPQGSLKPGGFPLSWLRSLLSVSVSWAAPTPPTPRQESGTAVGLDHNASTSDTRSGGGAGSPKGAGQGELPGYAPSARKVTAGQSAKGGHGFDPSTSQRVPGKSTATSTYYANADGSYTRRIVPTPVNYRDGAGNWQPIDTNLRRADSGRWQEAANSPAVGFAATADDPNLVAAALDGTHTVSYGLAGAAAVTGVASGPSVTYPAALPATDVRLTSTPSGMREDLVLHSATAGNTWQFPLDLHGMTASVAKDGSIELDADGKAVGSIPPSYAYDSKVDPKSGERPTTHATRYDLATVDGRTVLTLTVDAGWLRDPSRVFPVTVDPSVTNTQAITTYAASGTTGDHSMEDVIKIGSYDSGTHSARSFLQFPASGIDNSQISVSAASLDLFVNHANACPTAERFDVAPVTQDWTPSSVTTFPGPTMGASIGNLTPSTPNACANTAVDPMVGDWVTVPLSVATFNGWANGSVKDYGLGVYASETDAAHWKYLGSAYTNQPNLTLTYTGNVAPAIIAQYPNNGAQTTTLTPLLSAEGTMDFNVTGPNPDGGPQFQYQVYDSAGTKVVDSGLVNGAYTVPAGKLQWAKTYVWEVQAFDGANFSPNPSWYQLTTQVPQPYITSSLSQNAGGHGFDPAIGNYTTSSTDADVATVGPSLSVERDYNSRDPRTTGAFGAAWSSIYDARAVERYAASGEVSTVVVTYPDGSEVGYARNADGSFTPPLGRAAKMIKLSNGYELIDKADTAYRFTQSLGSGAYGIGSVTDANGRAETFTWSGGHITAATSAVSGRALHLTWLTPSGASAAHVSTVVTDPVIAGQSTTALTWTYGYTGDQLTSVCPPGTTTACTRYGYTSGSPYYSQVLDQAPKSFWPLAETSGSTAASAVLASEGTDNGTYSNVTLANTAGPLSGSSVMAASFNGTSSMVQLPNLHVGQSLAMSMSLWFKTAVGAGAGVLYSSSDMSIRPTATQGNYNPTLYVGSDGKLLGQWWVTEPGSPTPIKSSAVVNDGHWHHVVLTGSAATQVMYLDGTQVGTTPGWGTDSGFVGALAPWLLTHNYLGTGFLGGLPWPDNPYSNDPSTLHAVYFNGSIADASFYDSQLTQPDVTALYQTATHPTSLLTSITRPSGNAYAAIGYAPVSGNVTTLTDENGGTWTVAAPTVAGSSQVYRASVLGAGPFEYYRLGEAAGASQAASEVKFGTGTYANTTLGGAGNFADEPAAAFNGTSSSVLLPNTTVSGSGAQSWGLWFKTTATGGVLQSTQASTLGGTTCPCMPMLWVSADGKLRGLAPSTTPTGPLTGGIAGKCVDDWGSGTADGTKIDFYACNGTGAQNFTVNADGTVRVFGKCIDVTGGGTADGTKVQLLTCNGLPQQVWQPYSGGLRNPQSGKCLDDPGSSTVDGTQLQIYTCNNSNAQHWTLSLASSVPVNDGKWHQAVLTSSGTGQTLYVDGVRVQGSTGTVNLTAGPQPDTYLGGGYTGTGWSNLTPATTAYFNGGLAEAAAYHSELTAAQVAAQFDAAHNSAGLTPLTTVKVTDPGSKTLTYQYDPLHGNRMISSTDGRGYRTSYGYDTSGFLYTKTDPNGAVSTTGHDADGNEVSKTTCQNQSTNVCSTTYMTYKANTMGVNQAKGATVTASSSYTGSGWSPAAVVDGNTTSVAGAPGWTSAPQTTATSAQWVQLDMGTARTINRVDLYPRNDVLGVGFPQAFTVAVSADGTTWNTVTTQTNYPAPTTPAPAAFGFTAQSVRYIKVNATTLRTDGSSSYFLQFAEIAALNDLPDPTAGVLLTQRDPRSSSSTSNTYLTSYGYDAVGDVTYVTSPPVPGFPNGRTSFVSYTDGTTVPAADGGFAPAGLPYRTVSPGNATYTVSYMHNGDVASSTDADGLVTRYTFDNLGRVANKTVNSGKPSGWWPLNQTSGTVVPDSSGVGNYGTASNVTWSGGAAQLNGSSQILVNQPVVNTAASYTLSAWVNLATLPTYVTPLISIWGNNYPAAEISYSGSGRNTWKFQTSDRDVSAPNLTVAESTTAATTGVWTHLAGVYDSASGTMTLYVNGAVAATKTTTNTWTAKWFYMGSFITGSESNVQAYQRALSASDISALYASGHAGTATSDTTPSGLLSTYGYDGEGRVTSEVDPRLTDRITGALHTPHLTTVFDADGNVRTQTVADDTGGDASRTRTITYNNHDQVQTSTDASQNTTSYTYDGYGNKTSETDPLGARTTYSYDANGHLLTQVLDNYTGDPVNPQVAAQMTEESRAYDPAGRLASITNAMGNVTKYTYTDDGLPVTATRTDSAGHNPFVMRSDTYDAAGNIVQEATNNGATTTSTTLDAASRPIATREDPSGLNRTTTVSYTADDQVSTSTRTDGAGATLETSATYDPMGHVTSKSVGSDGAGHPVGWWRLNQSGGSIVVDASGTGNTAASNSGVSWSGSAATFNGTTGGVTTNGPVLTTTASYSVSAWVNLAAVPTGFQTAVSQDATVNSGFYLQYSPTEKAWAFGQATTDTTGSTAVRAFAATTPTAATWYHLVGTYNSSTGAMTLYVNGSSAGTATKTGPFASPGPLVIGHAKYNGAATDFFAGQVANVQVYQRVLSSAEVSTLYGAGAGRTNGTIASSNQLTTSWRLDQRGLPLSMTDAAGNTTTYGYDEAGHLALTSSPTVSVETGGGTPVSAHPITTHGYNTFGDEVEQQDPDGNVAKTVFDADSRPVSSTMPSYTPPGSSTPIVPVTVRTYNKVGELTKVSDPLLHDTSYVYDQLGDLAQETDANSGLTHYTYDLNGQRLSATDPSGAQSQATYDALGRRITSTTLERYPTSAAYTTNYAYTSSTTDPGGAWLSSQTSPAGVVTSYGYDKLGEQTSVTNGASHTTTYRYDYLGRNVGTVLPDNSSSTVSYDQSGNPVSSSTMDPSGTVLATRSATYDGVGNILSSTDARNTTTRFTYDALGRMTQEVQPTTTSASITTTFGYDAAGHRTRFTDGRSNKWVYTYNSWGQQENETEPATATYTATADRTFTMSYDANGRPVRQSLPGNVAVTATYDSLGELKGQSGTGAGAATADRNFDYDPAGRVTSARTAAAGSAPATAQTFTYDDRGLLLTASGNAGSSSFSYTADGSPATRTDGAGTATYVYDTSGRLSTLADPASGKTLAYQYNVLDQVSSVTYGSGGDQRTFGYDAMHRLNADTLKTSASATVASITYGYDQDSNLTSKTTTGFAGSASNTYGYDLANRLTSWTAGTTTVSYGYDASGNRTQVGAKVYTYDARDQLTGDGTNSYSYTAMGTLASQTTPTGTVLSTSDAYGQAITQGTQTYAYDATGRLLKVTPATGTATQLTYSGTGNNVASDGSASYSRDPGGGVVGIGSAAGGGGVLALTDLHNDVVGDFTATGTALSGSTAYDPFGTVLATASQAGHLGYQSGWTNPGSGQVNMAARWYNPAVGQFTSRDTDEQGAVPASASFNPFAYADDNPLTGLDPTGHGLWSSITSGISHAASTVWNGVVDAYHATTSFVNNYIVQPVVSAATSVWNYTVHVYDATVNKIKDEIDREIKQIQQEIAQMNAQIKALNAEIKRRAEQASHVVATAYHATTQAVSTATTFVKNHAAAIGSFVVSTAVFMGCEAALGALTAGVGAVAGAVACGALSGAVGGLFTQGAKCFDGQKGACSASSFLKAGAIGGAVGGLAGLGGALGGKVLSAVGGKALSAIGGLFGRGGAEVAEGAAADAAASTMDTAAEDLASGAARSGTRDAADASGGEVPRGGRPSSESPGEQPRAGDEPGNACETEPVHSFTGSTPVLMADGQAKAIDQVKVGDKVRDAVPGDSVDRTHTVQAVIVTRTDHDFVDVTVAPAKQSGTPGRLARAALVTAAGIAAATAMVQGGTLTTTYHHPFYDRTQAAFVDAQDLRVGDELQTPDGGTTTVTALRLYHATEVTYDLTIDGLHTYYVVAGDTPVLVHNCTPQVWVRNRPGVDNTPQGPLPKDAGVKSGENLREGDYHYVVKKDGSLRAMHDDDMDALNSTAGHTSLADFEDVHMAGTFKIDANGQFVKFGNFSGHYRPVDTPGFTPLEDIARAAFAKHGLPAPGPNTWDYYSGPTIQLGP